MKFIIVGVAALLGFATAGIQSPNRLRADGSNMRADAVCLRGFDAIFCV
jgi:hypothetical protein